MISGQMLFLMILLSYLRHERIFFVIVRIISFSNSSIVFRLLLFFLFSYLIEIPKEENL